ncbi:MAG: class IIb bacteriocin, lactobin A/cerein 7B family [Bifidobacteriaceae bacterium]|jgi:lactobin A/cerein 7B family class IIb bacteriocin|nr:class IIb bacteriocin, lactobin A/cerein 7B family [Bifidobacteriaceae bacterium]
MIATLSAHDTKPSCSCAFQELNETDLMAVDGGIAPFIAIGLAAMGAIKASYELGKWSKNLW